MVVLGGMGNVWGVARRSVRGVHDPERLPEAAEHFFDTSTSRSSTTSTSSIPVPALWAGAGGDDAVAPGGPVPESPAAAVSCTTRDDQRVRARSARGRGSGRNERRDQRRPDDDRSGRRGCDGCHGPVPPRRDADRQGFGGLVAVRAIDLDIPKGAIVSLIGPNGAGKTTSSTSSRDFIDPPAGAIEFRGRYQIVARPRRLVEPFLWVAPSIIAVISALACSAPRSRALGERDHASVVIGSLIATLLRRSSARRGTSGCWPASGHLPQRPTQRHRRRRHRPNLPEHPVVPEHDRAGERAGRHAPSLERHLIDA